MSEPTASDDPAALIAELNEWNNGGGVHPEDWIGMVGNYELAIGYSLIFWPRFVRLEDYVFRTEIGPGAVRDWEHATGGRRSAVEAVVNHVHIADIHCNVTDVSEAQLRFLGRALRQIYEVKLKADFPELSFIVDFNDEPGLDPADYQITFYQPRK